MLIYVDIFFKSFYECLLQFGQLIDSQSVFSVYCLDLIFNGC